MSTAVMSHPASELDLVERHRLGDPQAFEEIYRQHDKMVFNLALRMTGDREDAAELTQEVFLRVYRHLERFRGRSTLKTWVFRIAINCCRNHFRRRKLPFLDPGPAAEDAITRAADPRPDPEQDALNRSLGDRLDAALGQLPRVFREAVVLRDVHGLAYDEISRVLRVRIGTVRSRIARGRDRLQRLMEDET